MKQKLFASIGIVLIALMQSPQAPAVEKEAAVAAALKTYKIVASVNKTGSGSPSEILIYAQGDFQTKAPFCGTSHLIPVVLGDCSITGTVQRPDAGGKLPMNYQISIRIAGSGKSMQTQGKTNFQFGKAKEVARFGDIAVQMTVTEDE